MHPYPYTKDGRRRCQPFTEWPDPWVLVGALAQVTTRLRFYQTPGLEMQPTPPRIPVYIGGLSETALRRAARHDGWIGDLITTDRAIAATARLRELRTENGLPIDGFTILTPLTDAITIADYQRAEAAGITGILTMPWMFYAGPNATLAEKVDGMKRFRKDLALDA